MHDVARAAGVGTMTVSRVLNGSEHVAPETAARVRAAVEQLAYRPNEMARALRNSKSRAIGLLLPNLYDPFYATCAHALNMVAREHDYTVLLTLTNDNSELEYAEALRMMQRHIEGIAVIPAEPEICRLGDAEFHDIPVVTIDRPLGAGPGAEGEADGAAHVDSVITENQRGARLITEHLIQVHGLERILFVGHRPSLYTMERRAEGYREAMWAAGLKPETNFECHSEEAMTAILTAALARPSAPQAIFSANNLATRYALSASLRRKVRVPEQIALVGFDDLELSDLLHPALTVVRQPSEQMGLSAGRLLFSRLGKLRRPGAASRLTLPLELLVRHSCGCAYDPFRAPATS